MTVQPDLTVLIPVRDEAGNLIPLVGEVRAALDGVIAFEIVFVDDGSTDGSGEEMARLAAAEDIALVRHPKSLGKSRALITGARLARAPVIVTIDGDLQDDPADIPKFWAHFVKDRQDPDLNLVVSGWRRNRKDSRWKWLVSRFANGIRGALLSDKTPDSGCGFKMFPRDKFLDLPHFDNMHRFLPALFRKRGLRLETQDVHHRPRARGKSKYGTWDRAWAGFWDLMGVIWLQKRTRYPEVREEKAAKKQD